MCGTILEPARRATAAAPPARASFVLASDRHGLPLALHVVERYSRISPDVISYEAMIEDPKVFTRPWKISMALYRRQEKNAQLLDFKCVEFVEELMYGEFRKKPLSR